VLFGLQAAPVGATEYLGAATIVDAVHLLCTGLLT